MPTYHGYHTISLFKESALFAPLRRVVVSCETFDCFLRLSSADADLHFAQGRCFSCGGFGHRAEKCTNRRRCERLLCSLLPDPYSECSVPSLAWFLLIDPPLSSVGSGSGPQVPTGR